MLGAAGSECSMTASGSVTEIGSGNVLGRVWNGDGSSGGGGAESAALTLA